MKTLHVATISCLAAVVSSVAAPPSDQSINEVLDVMNMPRTMDQILATMDQQMRVGMQRGLQQSLQGREPTAEQRAEVEKFQKKIMGIMRDELAFDKVKDIYVKAYRETFTQEEVDGLIAFYKSPVGKAYAEKVPVVMQRAGAEMQSRLGPMVQKLNTMQQEFLKDLEKSSKPGHSNS
jgi:uncharacterized protein